MSIESKIDELIAALDRNTSALAGTNVAPAKKSAAKDKPAPAPAAPAPAPAPAAPAEPAAPKVDRTEVAKEVTELADIIVGDKTVGRDKAIAILGEFGAKTLPGVPDGKLAEFQAKIRAALKELKGAPAPATSLV